MRLVKPLAITNATILRKIKEKLIEEKKIHKLKKV